MAPEQTGRMNRSTGSLSDLYVLGATLYEMLTGCLPFASDPMAWIHSHIARTPMRPLEQVRSVPAPVPAIITKLLDDALVENLCRSGGRALRRRHGTTASTVGRAG
jgi:serine/threonine protein kinase